MLRVEIAVVLPPCCNRCLDVALLLILMPRPLLSAVAAAGWLCRLW